jgi:hypothetical protein
MGEHMLSRWGNSPSLPYLLSQLPLPELGDLAVLPCFFLPSPPWTRFRAPPCLHHLTLIHHWCRVAVTWSTSSTLHLSFWSHDSLQLECCPTTPIVGRNSPFSWTSIHRLSQANWLHPLEPPWPLCTVRCRVKAVAPGVIGGASALTRSTAALSGRSWPAQLRYSLAIPSLWSRSRGFSGAHSPLWPLLQSLCSPEHRHRPRRLATFVGRPCHLASGLRTTAPCLAPAPW